MLFLLLLLSLVAPLCHKQQSADRKEATRKKNIMGMHWALANRIENHGQNKQAIQQKTGVQLAFLSAYVSSREFLFDFILLLVLFRCSFILRPFLATRN